MAIAHHISDYLIDHDIGYHVYPHPYAESASEVAREAHVPPSCIAKAVLFVVEDDHGYSVTEGLKFHQWLRFNPSVTERGITERGSRATGSVNPSVRK